MVRFNTHAGARHAARCMERKGYQRVPWDVPGANELVHLHIQHLRYRGTGICDDPDEVCADGWNLHREARRRLGVPVRWYPHCPKDEAWFPGDLVVLLRWGAQALRKDDQRLALRYAAEDPVLARAMAALVHLHADEALVDMLYQRSQRGEVVVFPRTLRLFTGRPEVDQRPFTRTKLDH